MKIYNFEIMIDGDLLQGSFDIKDDGQIQYKMEYPVNLDKDVFDAITECFRHIANLQRKTNGDLKKLEVNLDD